MYVLISCGQFKTMKLRTKSSIFSKPRNFHMLSSQTAKEVPFIENCTWNEPETWFENYPATVLIEIKKTLFFLAKPELDSIEALSELWQWTVKSVLFGTVQHTSLPGPIKGWVCWCESLCVQSMLSVQATARVLWQFCSVVLQAPHSLD